MAVKVYISRDAAALSVGAYEVAAALEAKGGDKVELITTGTRGMLWLEPLVEVETPKGRMAYGPVSVSDIDSLFEAGFLEGGAHAVSYTHLTLPTIYSV